MPSFEEHCRECELRLGNRFEYVHHWLDELAHNPHFFIQHRQFRHNQKGIEWIRKKWGDKAVKAAEIHIRMDLKSEGWPSYAPIPRDAEEYTRFQYKYARGLIKIKDTRTSQGDEGE